MRLKTVKGKKKTIIPREKAQRNFQELRALFLLNSLLKTFIYFHHEEKPLASLSNIFI